MQQAWHSLHVIVAFLCLSLFQSTALLVVNTTAKQSPSDVVVLRPPQNHTPYKLALTLEGGAFKGIMQTYILKEVRDAIKDAMIDRGYVPDALNASDFDVDLADWFPHIAGTSIGAVQALYYASRGGSTLTKALVQASNTRAGSPESALIMFDLLVQQLSGQTVVNMSSPIDPMLQLATSNTDTTRRALRTMFGNITLSDLGNTSVYLTTTDPLTRSSLDVFRFAPTNTTGWVGYTHNSTTRSTSPTLQVRPGVDFDVADVALASSAAVPALLPVRLVSKPGGNASNQINRTVVDGAFAHNNPSASMVAFLLQQQYTRDDLAVLSIGNGDAVGVADDPVSVFKQLTSDIGALFDLAAEAGLQKAVHAATEAMMWPDGVRANATASPTNGRPIIQQYPTLGSPSRLLRLDLVVPLSGVNGSISPVPNTTAAAVLQAAGNGTPSQSDTYEKLGKWLAQQYSSVIQDFVRAYVVPPLTGRSSTSVQATAGGT